MTFEDDIAAFQKQAAEMSAKMEELKDLLGPLNEAKTELNAERHILDENYREARKKIDTRFSEVAEKAYEIQVEVNKAQQAVDMLKIKEQQAKDAKEAAKKAEEAAAKAKQEEEERLAANAALTERWDLLTRGAQWRELAKPHQIDAGHKITLDRNVILADPMGLGKTLSAIITCDMAFAASKDASPENPWLGDEQQVYVAEHYVWTPAGLDAFLDGEITTTSVRPIWDLQAFGDVTEENRGEFVAQFVNSKLAYLPYDVRERWRASGYIRKVDAHYKTEIVNKITRPVGRRVLYLCPASLQRNVYNEFRMWAKHRNVIYIGGMSKAERQFALDMLSSGQADNFILICNYEAWRRDWALIERFCELGIDTVIIDEAHNAKEMKTNINKGIQHILENARPEYVIPMTGTPVLNRPQELFTLLHMVNPQRFADLGDFLTRYCYEDDKGFWRFKEGGLEALAKLITKNFLRRTKSQAGIELPEKTVIMHEVEVDEEAYPNQARARKQMRDFATLMVGEATKGGKTLSATVKIALITRLRQIETWPAGIIKRDPLTKEIEFQLDVEESQKIDYIIRMSEDGQWDGLIPEAIEDERIVLFSQFKAPLREIKRRVELSGYRAVILDGDTPASERDAINTDFDARYTPDRSASKWDIVLCNYKVGGVGLNFTAATQGIILDEAWNPGVRDQAYDRMHRIGQKNAVTIHVIRALQKVGDETGGIDSWLGNIMDTKSDIVGGFEQAATSALDDFQSALDSGLI